MVIKKVFGAPTSSLDIVTALNKAIGPGDHHADIAKKKRAYCHPTWTGQIPQMQARVKELFPPLQQLAHARQTEAYRLQQTQQAQEEEAKTKAVAEIKKSIPIIH